MYNFCLHKGRIIFWLHRCAFLSNMLLFESSKSQLFEDIEALLTWEISVTQSSQSYFFSSFGLLLDEFFHSECLSLFSIFPECAFYFSGFSSECFFNHEMFTSFNGKNESFSAIMRLAEKLPLNASVDWFYSFYSPICNQRSWYDTEKSKLDKIIQKIQVWKTAGDIYPDKLTQDILELNFDKYP